MKAVRQLFISLAVTVFFLGVLLVCAGRLNYWPAWAYTAIAVLANIFTRLILRNDPDLARERAKPGAGAQSWDKALLGISLLLTLAMLVVAGLDSGRFHWTPRLSWIASIVGIVLNLAAMIVFLLALKENRFFSAVVRLQTDRGQTVCKTGPYAVVRHPGNAGMILGTIGFPLLFMSAWCAIPALLSVIVIIVRTHLEDVLLATELAGYRDYQQATRFRLAPGVW
jgi:protein-S-isoprenylcysteine O-methyltransferase Ste14